MEFNKYNDFKEINLMAYNRIKTFTLEEVLPFTIFFTPNILNSLKGLSKGSTKYKSIIDKNYLGYPVKMSSQRYQLFHNEGTTCVNCGLTGTFFALEQKVKNKDKRCHFNLYGINSNGHEVLFTKDHIIPKSKGGKNVLSNYQVMCYKCNEEKGGNTEKEIKEIAEIKKGNLPIMKFSGAVEYNVYIKDRVINIPSNLMGHIIGKNGKKIKELLKIIGQPLQVNEIEPIEITTGKSLKIDQWIK